MLFCDLVGSTALSATMDAEDYHELLVAYQRYCAACVEQAGGYVAHYAGDGVMAFFGYPIALEDAPQRAIHAALRLRLAGERLPRANGQPLAVRMGLATGVVVVGNLIGEGSARERAVAGETPNLAARLQTSATPNAVVVSERTKQLAEGVFEFRDLGLLSHKGLPSPAPAWEVVGQRPTVSRFEGRRGAGVSPLIDREAELDEIMRAWREARGGRCRVVGIVGDPGLGKSRLLEEARRRIRRDASTIWLEGGGVSIHYNTPFHVVSQFISSLAALSIGASGVDRSRPLHAGRPLELSHALALIEGLVAGGERAGPSVRDADTALDREDLMGLLSQWIWDVAERSPTVLVVEDLHWVDPSTLELLDLLVKTERERSLLIIYTSRKGSIRQWPGGERHRAIALKTLDDNASAKLARSAGGDNLTLAQVNAVVYQAAGVPLYIEELARWIASRGAAGSQRGVPPTLADLMAVRLEELGAAKRYAQIASVLGHEFPTAVFAAMVEPDGVDPAAVLAELQTAAIIIPGRKDPRGAFAFRHALIATAAYEALLRRQRRELHGRAARIVTELFPTLAETQPQVLARHWAQAADREKAVAAWEKAGDAANDRGAFQEAEIAYREALSILDGDVTLQDHDDLELRIRRAFNRMVRITQAYSAIEAEKSSRRVSELAVKTGNPEALTREESEKWRSVLTAGDLGQAEAIVTQVMALTAAHGDALWRRTFNLRTGIQQGFYTGDLARGERDFLAWSVIQDGSHRAPGDDVLSMGIAGLIAQMTGRQAVAEQRMEGAFAIARRRGDPYDFAMALHAQACLHHFSQDPAEFARSAARLAEVANENGYEYASCLATGWLSIADINAGQVVESLEKAQDAISGLRRLGALVSMVFWLSVLARAHHLNGDHDAALGAYSEAMACNRQERAFRVETHLGRALLLSDLGKAAEAERDLRHGIRLAASMGATSFQLRCLVELARMQLIAGDRAKLSRTLRSVRRLTNPDLCAAELASIETLSRERGIEVRGPGLVVGSRDAPQAGLMP